MCVTLFITLPCIWNIPLSACICTQPESSTRAIACGEFYHLNSATSAVTCVTCPTFQRMQVRQQKVQSANQSSFYITPPLLPPTKVGLANIQNDGLGIVLRKRFAIFFFLHALAVVISVIIKINKKIDLRTNLASYPTENLTALKRKRNKGRYLPPRSLTHKVSMGA